MNARARIAAAVVLAATAVGLSIAIDREALAQAVVPALARIELANLDQVAGLRDGSGAPSGSEPLPVGVAIDGPPWVTAAVTEVVATDEVYAVRGGPHAIVGEIVAMPSALALRLSLERRGWRLHAAAVRRRLQPALAIGPAAVGIGVWAWTRRVALAVLVAGGLAQLVLAAVPWPAELVAAHGAAEVASGPVGALVLGLARGLDRIGVAVAAGIAVATTVLAIFEQRRSPRRGGMALAVGVLGVLGALAWIEAAGRASVGAWAPTVGGIVAVSALVAAIAVLRRSRTEARA